MLGKLAGRFLKRGGKDTIIGSIPGALATSVMSTVTTGNPLAGIAIGATDLALSSALARGMASSTVAKGLTKLDAQGVPLAGKVKQALPGRYIGKPGGQRTTRADGKEVYTPNRQYMLSTPQAAATAIGSVGAAITLEPYFYPKQEAAILAEQYPRQMGARPEDQSQMLTQSQQLEQLKYLNNLQEEANTPGTMYQLQGMPTATLGAGGLDKYNLMRGSL